MREKYFPKEIEDKWQKHWEENQTFKVDVDSSRPKFYCLEMLPYPSGRIHMGHVRNYSIGDALAWYKRMNGFNVLHPMGWDAFGLPAENAAIDNNAQPENWTLENIAHMRAQLKKMGIGYDWSREIASCLPDYYRWNQWFFIKMFERGLLYKKRSFVNWCPECNTVLANEQAEGGVCWRHSSTPVIQKELDQWFIRLTNYAQELLDGITELEGGWPERVLTQQRNWIGRSEGARVNFRVKDSNETITIFTTRIDTIYGANAIVLAPEHLLIETLLEDSPIHDQVIKFANTLKNEDRIERTAVDAKKQGIYTGRMAINPFNGENLPIWIANFVLMEYGTGAIMSVPGHDQRDFEFSREYGLPINQVIAPLGDDGQPVTFAELTEAYSEDGVLINSGEWNGLPWPIANQKMTAFALSQTFGEGTVHFRIRDWGISRQRYWGTPIPIIYCDSCGIMTVPEDQLPVELPKNIVITGKGGSPLAQVADFVNTKCPKCNKSARRETDTMDTFVDSSWYYFRYCDPKNDAAPFDKAKINYWLPVNQYVGGIEHAVLHLIYTRFWSKMMRDLGLCDFNEPISRLLTQGMVCMYAEKTGRVEKMSKSLGNVIDPDEMIAAFGADTTRLFALFAAPPEKDLDWNEKGVEGGFRFLTRAYKLVWKWHSLAAAVPPEGGVLAATKLTPQQRNLQRKTHQTIKRVTENYEDRMHFNTMISALMELVNEAYDFDSQLGGATPNATDTQVMRAALESLALMLAPFAPHAAEEMWEGLGHKGGILSQALWPKFDSDLAKDDLLEIPIQINGKLRSRISVIAEITEEALKLAAFNDEKVKASIAGKEVANVIVVPRKLVNIVVKG